MASIIPDSTSQLLPEIAKPGATQTRSKTFLNQNKFYAPAKLVQIEVPSGRLKIEQTKREKHERLLNRLKINTKLHTMQEVGQKTTRQSDINGFCFTPTTPGDESDASAGLPKKKYRTIKKKKSTIRAMP
jgi:hypothetical protein